MEKLVLDRVKEFISAEKLSINAFSKIVGMPQTTINDYMLGKRKCAFALIDSILTAFPRLSAEWLLRGTGSMYLTGDIQQAAQEPAPSVPEEEMSTSDKDELISSLKARIAEQENYIADLRFMARLDKKQ